MNFQYIYTCIIPQERMISVHTAQQIQIALHAATATQATTIEPDTMIPASFVPVTKVGNVLNILQTTKTCLNCLQQI